jgi:hypothetical protein
LALREVDDNNLPLYSMLMDNIIAGAVTVANIDPQADNTLHITYAKNLLNKCIQQLQDGFDSLGQVYSRPSSNRATSTGNRHHCRCPRCQPAKLPTFGASATAEQATE